MIDPPSADNCGSFAQAVQAIRTSLILVGSFASGKTTTCGLLSQQTGLPYVDIGDVVRRQAELLGLDPLTYAKNEYTTCNTLVFAKMLLEEARRHGKPCIIGGLRRLDELKYLRQHLAPAVAIALTLSDEDRWQRLVRRRFTDDPRQEWTERQALEKRLGFSSTVKACNARLSSDEPPQVVANECLAIWLAFDKRVQITANAIQAKH